MTSGCNGWQLAVKGMANCGQFSVSAASQFAIVPDPSGHALRVVRAQRTSLMQGRHAFAVPQVSNHRFH